MQKVEILKKSEIFFSIDKKLTDFFHLNNLEKCKNKDLKVFVLDAFCEYFFNTLSKQKIIILIDQTPSSLEIFDIFLPDRILKIFENCFKILINSLNIAHTNQSHLKKQEIIVLYQEFAEKRRNLARFTRILQENGLFEKFQKLDFFKFSLLAP